MKKLSWLLLAIFLPLIAAAQVAVRMDALNLNNFRTNGNRIDLTNGVVRLIKPNGIISNYFGSTDLARGSALSNAQAYASSGDSIFVNPGFYRLDSGTLGKDGVNWWFAPGSTVSNSVGALWSDSGSAKSFSVGGSGIFIHASDNTAVIYFTNTASVVNFTGQQVKNSRAHASGGAPGIYINGGNFTGSFSDGVYSDGYDAIWVDSGAASIKTSYVRGGDNGVEIRGGTLILDAQTIISSNGPPLNLVSGTSWIFASSKVERLTTSQPVVEMLFSDSSAVATITTPSIVGKVRIGTISSLRIIDAVIDSSAVNEPTADLFTTSGLTLQNTRLITHSSATESVNAVSAGTVLNITGTLTANKAIDANAALSSAATQYVIGSGSGLTNLNASSLASGTVPDARLGTSTSRLTNFTGNVSVSGNGTFDGTLSAPTVNATTVSGSTLSLSNFIGSDLLAPTNAIPADRTYGLVRAESGTNAWALLPAGGGGTVIPSTVLQTNFVLNQVYSNASGTVQQFSGLIFQQTAGVNGQSGIAAMISTNSGSSFTAVGGDSIGTTIGVTLIQVYTNTYIVSLNNGDLCYLTNISAGAGNSASLVPGSGQITTVGAGSGITNNQTGVTLSGTFNGVNSTNLVMNFRVLTASSQVTNYTLNLFPGSDAGYDTIFPGNTNIFVAAITGTNNGWNRSILIDATTNSLNVQIAFASTLTIRPSNYTFTVFSNTFGWISFKAITNTAAYVIVGNAGGF